MARSRSPLPREAADLTAVDAAAIAKQVWYVLGVGNELKVRGRSSAVDLRPMVQACAGWLPIELVARLMDVSVAALRFALAWAATTATGREFALDWSTDWVRACVPDHGLLACVRAAVINDLPAAARFRRWVESLPEDARMRTPPWGLAMWPMPPHPQHDDPAWRRQALESRPRW